MVWSSPCLSTHLWYGLPPLCTCTYCTTRSHSSHSHCLFLPPPTHASWSLYTFSRQPQTRKPRELKRKEERRETTLSSSLLLLSSLLTTATRRQGQRQLACSSRPNLLRHWLAISALCVHTPQSQFPCLVRSARFLRSRRTPFFVLWCRRQSVMGLLLELQAGHYVMTWRMGHM
jgi:hypothetical protein